jgi:hypothetical protein
VARYIEPKWHFLRAANEAQRERACLVFLLARRASEGLFFTGATAMSIVRLGMAENKSYGDGYDAIFAKKSSAAKKPVAVAKKPTAKKAPAKKPAKKK